MTVSPPLPLETARLSARHRQENQGLRQALRGAPLLPALLVAVLAMGTFWLTRQALIDDAYITLSFAKNLGLHGTWGLLSGTPSATATSPAWVLMLLSPAWKKIPIPVLSAVLVAGSWLAYSWVALGSAIPDTLLIKAGQTWGIWGITNGWQMYRERYPVPATVAMFAVVAGLAGVLVLLALLRTRKTRRSLRNRPWLVLALAVVVHLATLRALTVAPYHWYYGPTIALSLLVFTGALGALASKRGVLARGLLVLFSLATLVQLGANVAVAWQASHARPWALAPIKTNWMSPAGYERMGLQLRQELTQPDGSVQRVQTFGEIGHVSYLCDCAVDGFADPQQVVEPAIWKRLETSRGVVHDLYEFNYEHRDWLGKPVALSGKLIVVPWGQDPVGAPAWNADLLFEGRDVVLLMD